MDLLPPSRLSLPSASSSSSPSSSSSSSPPHLIRRGWRRPWTLVRRFGWNATDFSSVAEQQAALVLASLPTASPESCRNHHSDRRPTPTLMHLSQHHHGVAGRALALPFFCCCLLGCNCSFCGLCLLCRDEAGLRRRVALSPFRCRRAGVSTTGTRTFSPARL